MRKTFPVILLVTIIVCSALSFSGCAPKEPYALSGDFINISVTFFGDTRTSRGFSFATPDDSYADKCAVQLDPAAESETTPSFGGEDNLIFNAASKHTKDVFPKLLRHYAVADTLTPSTKYFYRVIAPLSGKCSEWGYFRTDDGDNTFSFMHITDSQAESEREFTALNDNMQKAYDTVGIPEFIVSTGDQVEFGRTGEYWDSFFSYTKDFFMKTTMAPVNGNHEFYPESVLSQFHLDNKLKLVCYSFEYGDALFVVMDTNSFVYTSQLAWAENLLTETTKKWKIVCMHKSAFSTGTHADDYDVKKVREEVAPALIASGADLVLSGHDHVYARTYAVNENGSVASFSTRTEDLGTATKYYYDDPEGAIFVVNRCIGIKFYNKAHSFNDHVIEVGDPGKITKPVFSNVVVNGSSLSYTAYEYDNEGSGAVTVMDAFVITKTAA